MRAVFACQLKRFARDRALVVWPLVFPLILTVIFMQMFTGVSQASTADPVPLGVVEDEAYAGAPGLKDLLHEVSDPDSGHHYADITAYDSALQARRAALEGQTIGYLAVEEGLPVMRITVEGNSKITTLVLRRMLDVYVRTLSQHQELAASGADPQVLESLAVDQALTSEALVTPTRSDTTTRYYFALLAFTLGMGMMLSVSAVQGVMATSGPLGARRTLAAVPRWKVLGGSLAASWLCITACTLVSYVFMRVVAQVDFGPRAHLAPVVVIAGGLMSCAAGAALGTVRGLRIGSVSGIACLLSLFTGLYGQGTQRLADQVERNLPVASWINPLWQSARGFYTLLYYDSPSPFLTSCGALVGMSALFLVIAVIRIRRMSHDRL